MSDGNPNNIRIGAPVTISELNVKGRVISIWITRTATQYEVRYFDKGEARTVYFFRDEIEEIP